MRTKQAWWAIAALVAGAVAAWLAATRTFVPYQTASAPLALLVGWSFIGSGLAACRVRPGSPLGKVMVLTGFAWFASFLTDAHQSLPFSIGTAVQSVYLVGFVYLVLSFPSGRLRTRLERALIWAGVAVVTVVPVASLLFADSRAVLCEACPGNALEVARDDAMANALIQAERIAGVGVVLLALAVIVARWRRASALQRR
ncbi:MAG: hypothetical protein JO363_01950, partial [Solirubrobacterales bacterium]|nr:hypothetical protein [Solirubrobacterales bacterium]